MPDYTTIYQQVIGRPPTTEELTHHQTNQTGEEHLRGWLTEHKSELVATAPAPTSGQQQYTTAESFYNQNIDTSTPTPTPAPAPAPAPVSTTTTAVEEQKPYVRNPGGIDIYDRQGNYISAAMAAQIPNFWEQVEISEAAPSTSKGAGLGGPVSGDTDLPYIRINGTDVYNKATGEYVDFDTANRLNIWNQIEDNIDPKVLEDKGIDPTGGDGVGFQSRYGLEIPESPYQRIYNDFKKGLDKVNDKLDQAWLEYNMAVVEIEENPWLLTGEVTQELKKLKKQSMAKINALTGTKQAMLDEFNLAIGITEAEAAWEDREILSITEAEALGVPYGTTRQQAVGMGVTPGAGEVEDVNTQVVTAGGRTLLINKQTGETIRDLGGAYKATGGGGDVVIVEGLGLDKSTLTKLGNDLEDLWEDALAGKYGVEGAREKIIDELAKLNVAVDKNTIATLIYGDPTNNIEAAIPDGYEEYLRGAAEAGISSRLKSYADAYRDAYGAERAMEIIRGGIMKVNEEEIKLKDSEIESILNYLK